MKQVEAPALKGYTPPTAFVQNIPIGKTLNGNTYYYFEVSNSEWLDGKWQRVRMKLSKARRIAKQINYGVAFSGNQTKG